MINNNENLTTNIAELSFKTNSTSTTLDNDSIDFCYQFKPRSRTGREIKIDNTKYNINPLVSVKVGTVDNKHSPQTVFVNVSFWIDIKNREELMQRHGDDFDRIITTQYSRNLYNIYKYELISYLKNNHLFPYPEDNIFYVDFTDNINYNDKRSFTSIELSLHTINCKTNQEKNYMLSDKKDDAELFNELLKIANIISETTLLRGEMGFNVYKRKK